MQAGVQDLEAWPPPRAQRATWHPARTTDGALAPALRALPHFKTLPADLLAEIASASRVLHPGVGEILFHEGEPCRAFYAIQSGAVKLYHTEMDGHEQVVHSLRAGATFAEAALLSFGRFPVNAVVTEPSTELIEIGGGRLLELFRSDARLAPAMVGSLCMRLQSLVERVEELSLVQAGARLARWLLRQPSRGTDEPTIELHGADVPGPRPTGPHGGGARLRLVAMPSSAWTSCASRLI